MNCTGDLRISSRALRLLAVSIDILAPGFVSQKIFEDLRIRANVRRDADKPDVLKLVKLIHENTHRVNAGNIFNYESLQVIKRVIREVTELVHIFHDKRDRRTEFKRFKRRTVCKGESCDSRSVLRIDFTDELVI